jgi:hypothetical protein
MEIHKVAIIDLLKLKEFYLFLYNLVDYIVYLLTFFSHFYFKTLQITLAVLITDFLGIFF